MHTKSNESGRTMLEMMGVLAIMGVIMYGAIAGINFGVEMYKVTATYNDLEQAVEHLSDLYSWSRDGYPVDPDVDLGKQLCENGLDPIKADCEAFSTRWTGAEVVFKGEDCVYFPETGPSEVYNCLQITLAHYPAFACKRLRAMQWTSLRVTSEDTACDAGTLRLESTR